MDQLGDCDCLALFLAFKWSLDDGVVSTIHH
jgi:hypothetical protein